MKRFTETLKWDKAWFQDLPPHLKCLWQFICDRCDCAGVWEVNWKAATFAIGKSVSDNDLAAFEDRVQIIKKGKLWIVDFIAFQYGRLSRECRPHIKIFDTIEKHGLTYTEDHEVLTRTRVGHVSEGKRKAILLRDENKCVYCGSLEALEPDHIVPRSKGGTDDVSNLVTACHACNTLKNDKSVDEFISIHPERERVLEYVKRVLNTLPARVMEEEEEEDKETDQDKEGGCKGEKSPAKVGYSVPACFAQIDGFTAALGMWIENRKAIKKPATSAAIQLMLHKLAERPSEAIIAIQTCVRNGWQGFEWGWIDKDKPRGQSSIPGEHENLLKNVPIFRP
jgi:hypothetical protein